jgi:4-hydroxy-2-oxoheptanedioate aldolase
LSLGVGIRQSRTVDIGKIMAASDYDWLFIDIHNSMDVDTASQISVAAQDAGICPIVRVPDFAHHHATRVLDCGAMGIVFPHVDDAYTARKLVSYCLYPPKGHRSMTGSLPQLNFEKLPIPEVAKIINESMLVVIMLESPTAIDNVEEIASIPGVDVILIGTNDLCMEMGIPGDYSNPKIKEAYKKVIAACNKYNKTPGMGGVYNEELMSEYITMGMRFILSGSDLSFMMMAAQQRSKNLRSFLKK